MKWFVLFKMLHIFAFSALFVFVVSGFHLARRARRSQSITEIAHCYAKLRRWITVPPIVVPILFVTGLILIESGNHSLCNGWLFYLIVISSFEMGEGIAHYGPYVRQIHLLAQEDQKRGFLTPRLKARIYQRTDCFFLDLHFYSFFLVFGLAFWKPILPVPFTLLIQKMESLGVWLPPLILILFMSIMVIGIRTYGRGTRHRATARGPNSAVS